MRLDLVFMARAYCAVIGATLVAMGLAAWEADRANPYLGALLGGGGTTAGYLFANRNRNRNRGFNNPSFGNGFTTRRARRTSRRACRC